MVFHHLGVACKEISVQHDFLKKIFPNAKSSDIIYDPLQEADLCLIKVSKSLNIELVSGKPVKSLLSKGISYYHTCFSVKDIKKSINDFKEKGSVLISDPKPAILFKNKLVCFLYTPIGIIELIENDL